MSRKRQAFTLPPERSTDPADYQHVPRAVAAMPKNFPDGFRIAPHCHERAQLIYATVGTMRVATDDGMWMVPPQRAVWMPSGVRHGIVMSSDVTMRTLYLREDAARFMPAAGPFNLQEQPGFLPSEETRRSLRAMRRAYARVVIENKAWGLPVIQWRDGIGVVEVPPEQLEPFARRILEVDGDPLPADEERALLSHLKI